MKKVKLMLGDNIESLKKLPDNSIDSIVSDPPYGLSFMNKKWDYDVPSVEFWKEVLRVLKPGGHILSFGGTRTYHRMVVNIEDAGFEIRDQIMWLYGSGFPKSHNIGKAIDKLQGNDREVVGTKEQTGAKFKEWSSDESETRWHNQGFNKVDGREFDITKGTSPYEGWGTALKPANEPICVARKPLSEKSVAENVLKWGTGGINIDGCRITIEGKDDRSAGKRTCNIFDEVKVSGGIDSPEYIPNEEGRFPANIILDEIAGELLDEQSGISKSSPDNRKEKKATGEMFGTGKITNHSDKGGASRFFYQAKVSKQERNMGLDVFEGKKLHSINQLDDRLRPDGTLRETPIHKNNHPTVKPVALMSYLVRLVTPPNGIVLDPFMGSGSTGIAAQLEGFRFCGMEMDADYFKIAEARIENYEQYRKFIKK
jgi:site-specific DNA-methyltransferase (adenine-specific)